MSTRKVKNKKKFDFFECWGRVQAKTELKNFVQLAELVETSVSNVTKRKGENSFPVEWAFKIGQQYDISTEWIMTGEEPARHNQSETTETPQAAPQPPPAANPPTADFLVELETWAREISGHQDLRWLEKQLETCLPTWRTWREEREAKKTTTLPTDKVA